MRIASILVILGMFFGSLPMMARAASSSANYILEGFSFDAAGGNLSSTNYTGSFSAGDFANNDIASTNYRANPGIQQLFEAGQAEMSVSISSNNVTLSPSSITTAAVSTGTTNISVITTATNGYALTLREVEEFKNQTNDILHDVSDGTVTAGVEEIGVAVSGTDAAFADDQAMTSTPLTLASKASATAGSTTTANFKAAVSPITPAGNYSGAVVIIATGKY